MSSEWELWLTDQYGARLELLSDVSAFGLSKVANDVGQFALALPPWYEAGDFQPDQMIEFWRGRDDGGAEWIDNGIIRKIGTADDANGSQTVTISGPTSNEILARRIIAYPAGSTEASQSGQAGDILREIYELNLGALSSDTDRDMITPGYMRTESDVGDGEAIVKAFAWRNLLKVMQDICGASYQAGTRLYFQLVPTDNAGRVVLQLRVSEDQPGENRTGGTYRAAFVGPEWGNMNGAQLINGYEEEVNYVYAAGQGAGSGRTVEEVGDASRYLATIWNRREALADGRRETTTNGLVALGQTALTEGRPYLRLSGSILETPQFRYGVDWRFGDRITVDYAGVQADAVILAVSFDVNQDGQETIGARVEVLA